MVRCAFVHFQIDLDETPLGPAPNLRCFTFFPRCFGAAVLFLLLIGIAVFLIHLFFFGLLLSFVFFFINFCYCVVQLCRVITFWTQSRKCKILQCDEYQIVKITILIKPSHWSTIILGCLSFKCGELYIQLCTNNEKSNISNIMLSCEISLTCRLLLERKNLSRGRSGDPFFVESDPAQGTQPFPCLFNWSATTGLCISNL